VVSGWRSEKIGMGLGWFPEKKQIQKASSAVCTEEQRSCLQKKKNGVDMYKEELVLDCHVHFQFLLQALPHPPQAL
jgi:hypothetical protein